MLASSAILLAAAACFLVLFLRRRKGIPPGPIGLPFLGYLPFQGKNPPKAFITLAEKYGPVFSVDLGSRTLVILCDSDSIREALIERGTAFSGRPYFYTLEKSTRGLGVLFEDYNETCKAQIKFSHAVTKSLEKRWAEKKILDGTEDFLRVVESNFGKSFDYRYTVTKTACSIVCQIFMDRRYDFDDPAFLEIVELTSRRFSKKPFSMYMSLMTFMPGMRYFPPFSAAYKTYLDDAERIIEIIQKIVSVHKKKLDVENPRDFIDEYLIKIQETSKEKSTFNEKQLYELIREFFVGAMAPISNTYKWILLCLASFPDAQDEIFQEVDDVIGKGLPSMRKRSKMPYTCAFVQELMRYKTVVPMGVPHSPVADVKFRGFMLPKGMPVLTNIWAAHHDPKYFTNPDEFNPGRFIDGEGKFIKSDRVMPFGIGSRWCFGAEIGLMAIFLFLVNVVQKYRITSPEDEPLADFDAGIVGNSYEPIEFKVSLVRR